MGSVIFIAETRSLLKFLSIVYVILFLSNLHIVVDIEPVTKSLKIDAIK